jgi:hypothetical protein
MNPMRLNQLELIARWFRRSKEMDNPFDKFIALWISFNSFYACEHLDDSEARQLQILEDTYKNIFKSVVDANEKFFADFKNYIDTKPVNSGFIQDLRYSVNKEKNKKRYYNLTSFCEYLGCIYQVRCNLFHGGKNLEDGQDQNIVRYSYATLLVFLEELYKVEEIPI